ncbi:MAG: hypothetical protein H6810_12870 [Phycisphaeraceae bacterium]|nr:MAG: hypothetical protein H6810_12870 [Phycisphaeraceae bacterium]
MTATKAHRVFSETRARRDEARALLRALMDAKAHTERRNGELRQADFLRDITGRTAMDKAIESTRRLIDSFNRILDDLRRDLTDDDLALLAEIEHEHAELPLEPGI